MASQRPSYLGSDTWRPPVHYSSRTNDANQRNPEVCNDINEPHSFSTSTSAPRSQGDYWRPSSNVQDRPKLIQKEPENSSGYKIASITGGRRIDDRYRVLPKNFTKPLTCFYWATQGSCTKSNNECSYAHYWTDVVATAPVRFITQSSIAGREAEKMITQVPQRDEILKRREEAVQDREKSLVEDGKKLNKITSDLKVWATELHNGIEEVQYASSKTRRTIEHGRRELFDFMREAKYQRDRRGIIRNATSGLKRTQNDLLAQEAKSDELKRNMQVTIRLLEDYFVFGPAVETNSEQED